VSLAYFMLIAFGAFLLIGLATGLAMGRRGHDPWMWGVLGALFGPLVIPLLFVRRPPDERAADIVVSAGSAAPGGIAVLVGIDGSPEAGAAARAVVQLLADALGSITLATVVDLDAVDAISARKSGESVFERDARTLLDDAAAAVVGASPATVILGGKPADALAAYARDNGIDLIAVGARGRGLSEAVLGSVAEQLVRRPDLLVLVAGPEARRARPGPSAVRTPMSSAR
jgi:nucleotide-binding universal stress UspA family protein